MELSTTEYYNVYFDAEEHSVLIVAIESDGQERLVMSHRFGPFESMLDVTRLVWRALTLDGASWHR